MNRRHHTSTNVQSRWQCKLFWKKNHGRRYKAIFVSEIAKAD
jgi:hypothetical protein